MNFSVLKNAVAAQFERMQKHHLFRVELGRDELWQAYINAFPTGTNPVFRQRTDHDCACCRHFIRSIGSVVAIINNKLITIWDIATPSEPGYQTVAEALAALVRSKPIVDRFLHYDRAAGTDKNFEQLTERVQTWTHFFVNIDARHVAVKGTIPTKLGEERSTHDVFLRSLTEITDDAVETVLDLIAQRSLYRGEEHQGLLTTFKRLQAEYKAKPTAEERLLYSWTASAESGGAVARIRNTAIGTLLQDLSVGVEIDQAVRSFEAKVAPTNYKRPTSLITKGMIEKAKATLTELGLVSALDRRYAAISDITVNNVLFANRSARKAIAGDVFDDLTATAGSKAKNFDKVETVPIDRFIKDILPCVESIEIMFEGRLTSNLVSLITAADPTAGSLFKWSNPFTWSYNGEVADSIKEKVKKAGGNITGDLCCRLAWYNFDDLDLHMKEPGGGHIYFRDKRSQTTGGQLDVDMNAGGGHTREAVENIFYGDRRKMTEGVYTLYVNQFARRESIDVGFEVEIDFQGEVSRFAYDKSVIGDVVVSKFKYSHARGIEIVESLPSSQAVKTVWGIPTQTFHPVSSLMLSPNYWDGNAIGNKHYFFMLDGCKNDGSARGFFNEFLKPDLDVHRKVFEIVGAKMKAEHSQDQLSGLGFSSTQKNTIICRVKGSFSRTIKVQF